MNTATKHQYEELYHEYEKQRYINFVSELSNLSSFDDDIWICDKRRKSKAQLQSKLTIYFTAIPVSYRKMVKFFAILSLLDGKGISSVNADVGNIASFLKFMGTTSLDKITVTTASRFAEYLDEKGYVESTKSAYWTSVSIFLRKMNGFDSLELRNPFYKNIYDSHKLVDTKYIPEFITKQLDRAFMNEDIPITLRTIYWVLRLIPSRISEVIGMKIDCLKPFDDHYCLFIPMWKQNGGYNEPIMRTIHLNDEGMGGYLLALIREQEKMSLAYQDSLPKEKQGMLLSYRAQIKQKGTYYTQKRYNVATWVYVSYQFKEICKMYGVKDENGEIYKVTSHQFRHNGVTDRLKAGFTLPQIAEMTAHHGTAMLYGSYAHLNLFPETLIEPIKYETEAKNPQILFHGRILNMDIIAETRLLKNLRSHKVLGGICSDVTHCESGMWNCIDCEHFIPEVEQLPYFKEQVVAWSEKADKFEKDKQLYDNFSDISLKFSKIVEKLEEKLYNEK